MSASCEWCENWCRKFHKTVTRTTITRSSLKYRSLNVIKMENHNNKIKRRHKNWTKDFKKFMAFADLFFIVGSVLSPLTHTKREKTPSLEGLLQSNILKSAEKKLIIVSIECYCIWMWLWNSAQHHIHDESDDDLKKKRPFNVDCSVYFLLLFSKTKDILQNVLANPRHQAFVIEFNAQSYWNRQICYS